MLKLNVEDMAKNNATFVSEQKFSIVDVAGRVIFSCDGSHASARTALEQAVKNRLNLAGANLREQNLSKAYLNTARLSGADLSYAYTREAFFSFADLSHAKLDNAYMRDVDAHDAVLTNASLVGADLRYANFFKAKLDGANLFLADLSRANLLQCTLKNAVLSRADLEEANLKSACLANADLSFANLYGANLAHADFAKAKMTNTTLPDGVPKVDDLHSKLLEVVGPNGENLDMSSWHNSCGTTHCLGGWIVTLAGPAGSALEKMIGTNAAASLIYAASTPGDCVVPDWFASNEATMALLRSWAQNASK